ncbi:MAG: hypothetical protein ACTSQQ_03770, partial [Candidatus Helarchaeota archaeon]
NLAITKEEIQQAFDILVQLGVIGDDGDRDHMNYDESKELMELIFQILQECIKQQKHEASAIEEDETIISYLE